MVQITLSNQDSQSQTKTVNINLATQKCVLSNGNEVELKQFLKEIPFSHPLLTKLIPQNTDQIIQYEYDNYEGLLGSAAFVYSTLIYASAPQSCQIKICPSAAFKPSPLPKNIYFSVDGLKFAKKTISIEDLEKMIQEVQKEPFSFSNNIIINDVFTILDLPPSINGDLLTEYSTSVIKKLQFPSNQDCLELRFINSAIGFGVFCRKNISQNEFLFLYSGVRIKKHERPKYTFYLKEDSLQSHIDAQTEGNLSRFINHAPDPSDDASPLHKPFLLEANVTAASLKTMGLEFIVFSTKTAINKGEQLLVDYGEKYFPRNSEYRFTADFQVMNPENIRVANSKQEDIAIQKIMTKYTPQEPKWYLGARILSVVGFLVLGVLALHYTQI